jgi:hypothetical protein
MEEGKGNGEPDHGDHIPQCACEHLGVPGTKEAGGLEMARLVEFLEIEGAWELEVLNAQFTDPHFTDAKVLLVTTPQKPKRFDGAVCDVM